MSPVNAVIVCVGRRPPGEGPPRGATALRGGRGRRQGRQPAVSTGRPAPTSSGGFTEARPPRRVFLDLNNLYDNPEQRWPARGRAAGSAPGSSTSTPAAGIGHDESGARGGSRQRREGRRAPPLIIAITVLTSFFDQETLGSIGSRALSSSRSTPSRGWPRCWRGRPSWLRPRKWAAPAPPGETVRAHHAASVCTPVRRQRKPKDDKPGR